jgi:signal transduction histidine kinase
MSSSFALTIPLFYLAFFRYNVLEITPIAINNILDLISDGFIIVDKNGLVIKINKTFNGIFKNNSIKIGIDNLFDIAPLYNINLALYTKMIVKVKHTKQHVWFQDHITIDGIDKFFKVEISPILSKNIIIGMILLFQDISEIKYMQDSLIQKERFISLGQLMGGIAHNIRTPLMTVALNTRHMERLASENDELLQLIIENKTQLDYISNIITTVKSQTTDLYDNTHKLLVSEVLSRIELLMNKYLSINNCVLVKNMSEDVIIDINSTALIQVLNNLVINAIQAYKQNNNKKNEITISTSVKSPNLIEFSVKDSAGGIPLDIRNKIFLQTVTSKGIEGPGLGLYLSYILTKSKLNGTMWFQTNEIGSTFFICLPLTHKIL